MFLLVTVLLAALTARLVHHLQLLAAFLAGLTLTSLPATAHAWPALLLVLHVRMATLMLVLPALLA